MKKIIVILLIIFILTLSFVACGKIDSLNTQPSDSQSRNADVTPTKKVPTGSGKNSNVVALGNALDTVKTLEELTGTSAGNASTASDLSRDVVDTVLLSDDNDDVDEYTDLTQPPDWYNVEQLAGVGTEEIYYDFFKVNNYHYLNAKSAKNRILNSKKLTYLNIWYTDGLYKNRVTYDETINDLICESILDKKTHTEYSKLNIGRNKDGKLYYSYFYAELDDVPIYGGMLYQEEIEYLEDSHYNSYTIKRGYNDYDGSRVNMYRFEKVFYEVDLTYPGGIFYEFDTIEFYEDETFKRCDWDGTILKDGEHNSYTINSGGRNINCFWSENGTLITYRINAGQKRMLGMTSTGVLVFDLSAYFQLCWEPIPDPDGREIWYYDYNDKYLGCTLNAYEMTGIKRILGQPTKFLVDLPNGGGVCITTDYIIEFENGEVVNVDEHPRHELDENYMGIKVPEDYYTFDLMNNRVSDGEERYMPGIASPELEEPILILDELTKLGAGFKTIDFENIVRMYADVEHSDVLTFEGLPITHANLDELFDYFNSKQAQLNLDEIKQNYENVASIKIPYKIDVTPEIEGELRIKNDCIDLSSLKINLVIKDEFAQNFVRTFDLYHNDEKIWQFDFDAFGNFGDGVFTFENIDIMELVQLENGEESELDWREILNWQDGDVLFFRIFQYDIAVEIPIVFDV